MQSISPEFTFASAATVRQPITKLEVDWQDDGVWRDESAQLIEHSGSLRLAVAGDSLIPAGEIGSAEILLRNPGGRYSWKRSGSYIANLVSPNTGMYGHIARLWVGFKTASGNEYCRIFTGPIYDWREHSAKRQVTLNLRDMGFTFLQDKRSSAVSCNIYSSDWISSLATLGSIPVGAIDQGLFRLPFIWLDDEGLVAEIWDAAQADGGRVYFDQLGQLRFENALHWLMPHHIDSNWTFTEGRYQSNEPSFDVDNLATEVTVEWQARSISKETTLFSLESPKIVRPGESITFEARYGQPAYSVIVPVAKKDYKVISAGGVNITSSVPVTLSESYGQKAVVQITNNHPVFTAQVVYLQIRGQSLVGGPTEQTTVQASNPPCQFERKRSLRGNMYVQTFSQAQALATLLSARASKLQSTWRLQGAPGIPQLELGDRIQFSDAVQFGYEEDGVTPKTKYGFVQELRWAYSKERGFKQDLSMIDLDTLYPAPTYFYIGSSELGSRNSLWY